MFVFFSSYLYTVYWLFYIYLYCYNYVKFIQQNEGGGTAKYCDTWFWSIQFTYLKVQYKLHSAVLLECWKFCGLLQTLNVPRTYDFETMFNRYSNCPHCSIPSSHVMRFAWPLHPFQRQIGRLSKYKQTLCSARTTPNFTIKPQIEHSTVQLHA